MLIFKIQGDVNNIYSKSPYLNLMKHLYCIYIIVLSAILLSSTVHAQTIRYVKANAAGANNGTSWANAFTDLQSALDAAEQGDQIWVAQGTYKPSKDFSLQANPSDPRTKTFLLKNGVSMYGGFAGTETAVTQRNILANQTILSGDLDGNDRNNFTNYEDNAYHVAVAYALSSPTTLDGVTIQGGNYGSENYMETYIGRYGAGLYIYLGSNNLSLSNCTLSDNYVYNLGSGAGIGIYNSSPIIKNCLFTRNYADDAPGGAMYITSSSPWIENCRFDDNDADYSGGGVANEWRSNSSFINCVFTKNRSNDGGAILNSFSTITIINSTFTSNTSEYSEIIHSEYSATTLITNSLIWGNTREGKVSGISKTENSTVTITYSNIEGGYAGTGNINLDPLFADLARPAGADNIWGTSDDGLALTTNSPAINMGNNTALPGGITKDITGAARIQNGIVNMGAYETVVAQRTATTLYVKANATGANSGGSWTNAFTDLQAALDAAGTGDQIWVAQGTYTPCKNFSLQANPSESRTKTFLLKNGVSIYGGFAGTETALTQRNILANQTILSGDLDGNDGSNFTNYDENAYHVIVAFSITAPTTLDGVTVQGGNANSRTRLLTNIYGNLVGAGILIYSGTNYLSINNTTVRANYAQVVGGGIYNYYHSTNYSNCTFSENRATMIGGGIADMYGNFFNCVFNNNEALNGAGAAIGGGDDKNHRPSNLINCIFVNNKAERFGGGLFSLTDSLPQHIINCTFVDNEAGEEGAGIAILDNSVSITNSILWNNLSNGTASPLANLEDGRLTVTYSNIEGGYTGTGNINQDPLFFDIENPAGADNIWRTEDDGLSLRTNSPSINTGSNAAVPSDIRTDIMGKARTQNNTVNMGAYEGLAVLTSAKQLEVSRLYTLYPNPTAGRAFLQFDGASKIDITLTDITGKVLNKASADGRCEINLDGHTAGMYLIKVQEKGKPTVTLKLVKY
jgi:hypothetical protein